jgi:hypothetical protein
VRKNRKLGDLSDFEREHLIGERLAGEFVTKTAILLGVSKTTLSKFMLAYTNHGKITSAKRNSERNATVTEIDRLILSRIVWKFHRT